MDTLNVAQVLGIRESPASATFIERIEAGLPVSSLDRLAHQIAPDDPSFKFRLVPKATLARRRRAKRLSPAESERVARIAEIWQLAMDVWKSAADARAFLSRPHMLLEDRPPLEAALGSEHGARRVRTLLGRAKYSTGV
jgi:putative toxin-antitoxin system antitoxin component (TIGR02293 family)